MKQKKKEKRNEDQQKKPITLKEYIDSKMSSLQNRRVVGSYFHEEADLLRQHVRNVKKCMFDVNKKVYELLKENNTIQVMYDEICEYLDSIEKEIIDNLLELTKYNSNKEVLDRAYMLISNKEFLNNTYNKIDSLVNKFNIQSVIFVDMLIAKGQELNKPEINILDLPNEFIINLDNNKSAYPIIYYTENFLRIFITIKYEELFGDRSLNQFFSKCSKAKKTYDINKSDEEKYAWLKGRGDSPCFYLDFSDLKNLILSNWENFKKDFPDQSFVSYNFDEFYKIRCKVAHNSYTLEKTEYDIIVRDSYKIINQLEKYKDKIKAYIT